MSLNPEFNCPPVLTTFPLALPDSIPSVVLAGDEASLCRLSSVMNGKTEEFHLMRLQQSPPMPRVLANAVSPAVLQSSGIGSLLTSVTFSPSMQSKLR